ncbi:MAG: hypothetical protein EU532_14905 [Promethearchaeota archaeon]|nr:MAG: hypothetical protein EU532_14905 [Candidatus Lokiarchaeota archaeon]
MEIEKTRETTWKIHLKTKIDVIEITSVEVSGEIRSIKLALKKNNEIISVEMGKNEFFNFLSLVSAFKDVIIGENVNLLQDQVRKTETYDERYNDNDFEKESYESAYDENFEKEGSDELKPEEWDPW